MSRSSEGQGQTNACLWKGDDLSNNVFIVYDARQTQTDRFNNL